MKTLWPSLFLIIWGCSGESSSDSNTPVPDSAAPNFILADEGIDSTDMGGTTGLSDGGIMLRDARMPDDQVQSEYGGPCRSNSDCESGYCIATPQGFLCSQLCAQDEDCPDVAGPMSCNFVENFGADRIRICIPDEGSLCRPCFRDDHCFGGRCILGPQGNVCSVACGENAECPAGSECRDATSEGEPFETPQCVPDISLCDCTEREAGETRTCVRTEEGFEGRCFGEETCDPSVGWSGCNAPAPVQEVCDGLDNDCNGAIDDGLAVGEACINENENGSCPGTRLCNGAQGWSCLGPEPTEERCDPVDNDCDGRNDEEFINEEGLYLTSEHCGSCNVDCGGFYPLAIATECALIDGEPQCIITACREGFVLAGPTLCVPLASRICEPCERDVDCNDELGDRCIEYEGGARFCGRACGDDSPFGQDCPMGFSCDDGGQCRLDQGSCLCSANDNFILPCTVTSPADPDQRCVGTQTCVNGDLGRCELPPEICDAFDDDCDGLIDEDFVDPVRNQYTSDAHCGRCNNDCVGRLAGADVNGTGYCDASEEDPTCGVRCNEGFNDVNGVLADGCECQILDANADAPDAEGIDANCDGIDGEVPRGVFVSPTGDDTADGTRNAPLRTIQIGIERAGDGRDHVYVAAGVYAENITLRPGVSVFGGYSADFSRRDLEGNETAIFPPFDVEGVRLGTVTGIDVVGAPTRISGFTIVGHAESIPGRSSYAMYLRDSDGSLTVENNRIRAGTGGSGLRGQSGNPGADAPDNATTGDTESSARPNRCQDNGNNLNAGGQGGRHECPVPGGGDVSTNGGDGGSSDCPVFNRPEGNGQPGAGPGNGGAGGAGGYNQQLVSAQIGCACLVPGTPGATEVGIPGSSGDSGASGDSGGGCGEGIGRVIDGQWIAGTGNPMDSAGGRDGQAGGPGGGGGGGGAGSGVQHGNSAGCNNLGGEVIGGGGGGGGAGGCGGTGGTGGTSGGGSFGVFIFFTQPAASIPTLRTNIIERGFGGAGGDGGEGGEGGSGALGKAASALGGDDRDGLLACADPGGRGGDGGAGGDGAGGGGGCGGMSAGIYLGGANEADPMNWVGENLFPATGAAGVGGRGGLSLTNAGENGADGQYVEVAR